MSDSMKYRAEVDGLRALAVVPVIFFHAGYPGFSGGFVGVDVFFVISGYLITSIIASELDQGKFSIVSFYERRARRILPALTFVIACSIPPALFLLSPEDLVDFGQSVVATQLFASNVLFWREVGYFGTATELKPLLHTWSLAVEEQYYIFFPPLLMAIWAFARRGLWVILGASFVVSLAAAEYWSLQKPSAVFFLSPFRAWELLIGAFCALYLGNRQFMPLRGALADLAGLAGLLMILASIILYDKDTPFPGKFALLPTLGTAAVILFAHVGTWTARFLALSPFVGIGLISYSAYLWHQPLFAFARHATPGEPSWLMFGALTVLSLVLAWLSWKFVEAPFRNRHSVSRAQIFWFSGLSILLLGAAGFLLTLNKGWPERLPPRLQAMLIDDRVRVLTGPCDFSSPKSVNEKRFQTCQDQDNIVYLVGDSHTKAIADSLRQKLDAQGRNLIVLTAAGCLPIPGLSRDVQAGSECDRLTEVMWPAINRVRAPVIMVVRWRLNFRGDRYDNGEGGVESGRSGQVYATEGESDIYAIARSFLEERARQSPLILVNQIPEAGWHVPRTVVKREHLYGISEELTTSYDRYKQANRPTTELLYSVPSAKTVVEPSALVCSSETGRCRNQIGETLLYSDDDHPSRAFSDLISQEIVAALIDEGL